MKEVEDSKLVELIREGDKLAFKKLYDRYHKQLYYFAKNYLKDDSLVEDAIQDIFLKVWSKREELEGSLSVKSFLFTMLKNHILNIIRDDKTRQRILKSYTKLSENKRLNTTSDEFIFKEYQAIAEQALEKLSPARRKIYELRVHEGFSNSRIAKMRNVSENTVRMQFYLGTQFIRKYLSEHADIN